MGDGGELERVLDDVSNGTIMLRKANWDKTLQKSLKFSDCRKSIRKQIRPSCRKTVSTSFCVCLVSWKQRNLEIRANIPKLCRRPVVSLLYATIGATIGLYCSEFMLGMRTCFPCHIPDRWSRNANWIWPDLAFGFVHKRSGNEIRHGYYTTIMTSGRLFRHNPASRGTNQPIRKSEFLQCMKVE